VKNLDDAIDRAKTGKLTLCKFIHFNLHKDNPNTGLFDKDQELLNKSKILDFMEMEKSKSLTPPSNLSRSSTNDKKHTIDITPIDID
jgi:hypothetical protein